MTDYNFPDKDTFQALIGIQRYEEALGLPIHYSLKQLHLTYIASQTVFSVDPSLQELVSNVYNILRNELPREKGLRLYHLGYLKESIPILKHVSDTQKNCEIFSALGTALYRTGEYADAIPYLRSVAKKKEQGKIFLYLGLSLEQVGNKSDAISWLKKSSACGEEDALFETGRLLTEIKDYAGAEFFLKKSLKHEKKPDAQFLLSISCFHLGRLEEGLHHLQMLTANNPMPDYYHWSARFLIKMNQIDEAVPILLSLVRSRGSAVDFHWYGSTLLQQNETTKALMYLRKALEIRGDASDYLWYGIGLCQNGQDNMAIQYLELAQKMGAGEVCSHWLRVANRKTAK
jgi:tetratricopeptide (TPR) repeat protein